MLRRRDLDRDACLHAGAGRALAGLCAGYWSCDSGDVSIGRFRIEVEGGDIDAPTVQINGWPAARETTNDLCFAVDGTDERFCFFTNWF